MWGGNNPHPVGHKASLKLPKVNGWRVSWVVGPPLGNFLYQNNHQFNWPEILAVWTKFPPTSFKTIPTIFNDIPQFGESPSKKRRFCGFWHFYRQLWWEVAQTLIFVWFFIVSVKNIGSQHCGVVFWRKWGLNLEKWAFLVIFSHFGRLPQAQFFDP